MLTLTLTLTLFGASETVERLVVKTDQKLRAEVDVFAAQVTIAGTTKLPPSRLCPDVAVKDNAVTLTCSSRRIDATVEAIAGGFAVNLRALRGLPWRNLPRRVWAPERVGLGEPCPGSRPAGKAECLLAEGKVVDAKRALHDAVTTNDAAYAWVRTGDLALEDGDLMGGIEAYTKAGAMGSWGRLAKARLCEVLGGCLEDESGAKVFDPVALPAPLKHELQVRAVRADALMGNLEGAARTLLALGPDACEGAEAMCAELTRAALGDPSLVVRGAGLELWAALQPDDVTVTIAAADAAASLGAKKYAADLLASVTKRVPPGALEDHLAKAIAYYLDAGDLVRAQVIVDFAKAQLGDNALTSSRWRVALAPLGPRKGAKSEGHAVGTAQAIEADCQRADAVLTAAKKVGADPEPP